MSFVSVFQQVESKLPILIWMMGLIDGVESMVHFLNLKFEPEISKVPIMIDSSKWEILARIGHEKKYCKFYFFKGRRRNFY